MTGLDDGTIVFCAPRIVKFAPAAPAMALLERGVKVVDLGSDFRLSDIDRYESAYGPGHPHPDQLGRWPYGLPEMNRSEIARSDRVAVPGRLSGGCCPRSGLPVPVPSSGTLRAPA